MKMPEWMRRFADICTEGHLALLAGRSRLDDGELCALCNQPAEGVATIAEKRFCHGDQRPSCYERASRDMYLREKLNAKIAEFNRSVAEDDGSHAR